MAEVMLSKLTPPVSASNQIIRERLLKNILDNKQTRIVLISAPAGYGKTVLALQLSSSLNKPLTWLHIDHRDNDPALFLQYLVKGLQQHWPDIGKKALQLATRSDSTAKQLHFIASLIINDVIRTGAKPLIVFDDYHEITDFAVHGLVQEFIEQLPPGVFTVFTSRTTVPLSLVRFYLSGEARLISTAEIRFTREEIAAFLNSRGYAISDKILDEIESHTGGWSAAMELTGVLASGSGSPDLKSRKGLTCSLYDYLATEVFAKLPPEYQEFLLFTSVFKVLKPESCNYLLDRHDSGEILSYIGENLLLLTPLAGTEDTYICHQLFREFLLKRLGDVKSILQRRAGRLARMQGNMSKAVEHFLDTDFDEEFKSLLEDAADDAFKMGRWNTVARWLEHLTEMQINSSPWLSYNQAKVDIYRGRLNEAYRWISVATAGFKTAGISKGLAECLILKGRLARCRGRYREAMSYLDQSCSRFSEEETATRYDLTLEKGLCMALAGELRSAEKYLSKALSKAKQNNHGLAIAHLAETLGHLHYQQGRHAMALRTYHEAIRFSPDHSLPGYYIQDAIPYIYRDWGELDKALECARQSVEAKERYKLVESLPSAYCAISYVYFELNDFETVENYIRKGLKLLNEHGEERYFLLLSHTLLAWCNLARGSWAEARQLLGNTLTEAEKQTDLVCGLVQMMAGSILALMGELQEAKPVLQRAENTLEDMNFKTRLCEAYKAIAYVYHSLGEEKLFERYARKFLHLGARLNYIGNALFATAELLKPSLRFSLENDVEAVFAQRILARMGKQSHELLLELAEHSNPAVRQKVIAPLGEIADANSIEAINALAKDRASNVRQSALSYIHSSDSLSLTPTVYHPQRGNKELPPVDVKTFGLFQVFSGKEELTGWRTKKTRELLALLLHMEEPFHKERLIEELWPNIDFQRGSALFKTTMYYLRRHLGHMGIPDLICFSQDSYSIKSGHCLIDSLEFEKLAGAGLQEEQLREISAGLLTKAARLYRGDYLADPPDYTWALSRQVRLKHIYIDTLLALSRYYRAVYKNYQALDYLLILKEVDPLCEPAHRLRLQVYYTLGERKALMDEQHSFKLQLSEEIGLLPTPETMELYRRLGCHC